jgi:hypothetical protein
MKPIIMNTETSRNKNKMQMMNFENEVVEMKRLNGPETATFFEFSTFREQ